MDPTSTCRSRLRGNRALAKSSLTLAAALVLAGCGGSSEVMEIPEAARKSLVQKKVDVQPRAGKPAKSGPGSPNGR
jgi:hypothetical protein